MAADKKEAASKQEALESALKKIEKDSKIYNNKE